MLHARDNSLCQVSISVPRCKSKMLLCESGLFVHVVSLGVSIQAASVWNGPAVLAQADLRMGKTVPQYAMQFLVVKQTRWRV